MRYFANYAPRQIDFGEKPAVVAFGAEVLVSRLGTLFLFFALGPLIYNRSPLSAQTQTSPQSTRQSSPTAPSPPDMPLPDPASFPKQNDKTKPLAKRELDKLTPLCVDGIFHTCLPWGTGTAPPAPEAEREFAKNLDVGTTYFKEKNYKVRNPDFVRRSNTNRTTPMRHSCWQSRFLSWGEPMRPAKYMSHT